MLLGLFQQNLAPPEPAEPGAWAAGSWAPNAWAGTAWGPAPSTIGTAWFATAWAPGAWGTAAWASTPTAPPVIWDLDVPTLGPQFEATFSASGNFQFIGAAAPFNLVPAGPVALSAQFSATEGGSIVSSGRITRRGRTKFPQPLPPAPEESQAGTSEPPAPVSLLDTKAVELTIQQGVAVYRKRRVAILKRKLQIEVSDERAIEDALLELF